MHSFQIREITIPQERPTPRAGTARTVLTSVALSAVGLVLVAVLVGEPADLARLWRMDRAALASALALLALSYACGGARIVLLARAAGARVSFLRGIRAHLLGLFAAAVTPSGSGNHPALAVALRREGMPAATAWSITVYTTILDLLFFAWSVPVSLAALALGEELLAPSLAWLAIPAGAGFAGLWFVLAFRLRWLGRLVLRAFSLPLLRRWRRRATRFVSEMEVATGTVTGGGYLTHGVLQLLTALLHLSIHAIFFAYATLGLGAPLDLLPTLMVLLLVSVGAYLIPTPGGSGYVEFAASFMFTRQADSGVITPAVLAWRLTGHYLALVIGPILGGTMLARSLARGEEGSGGEGPSGESSGGD